MNRKLMAVLLSISIVLSITGCSSAARDNQGMESGVLLSAASESAAPVTERERSAERWSKREIQAKDETHEAKDAIAPQPAVPGEQQSAFVPRSDPNSKVSRKLSKEFTENHEDANNWLYDYLFGQVVTEDAGELSVDDLASSGQANAAGEPSAEELAKALKQFLTSDDPLAIKECQNNKVIVNFTTVTDHTAEEIISDLESRGLLTLQGKAIYDSMRPETQEKVQLYLPATSQLETPAAPENKESLNMAGKGHSWLVDIVKNDDAGVQLWKELSPKTRESLISSIDTKDEPKEGADSSQPEVVETEPEAGISPMLIVFMVVSAVLLIALIVVLILSLRRMSEMRAHIERERNAKQKLEQELEQRRDTQRKLERKDSPAGTMSPTMRSQFQNSPTRVSTPRRALEYQPSLRREPQHVQAPVEEPRVAKVGIGAAAAAAAAQRDVGNSSAPSFTSAPKAPTAVADNRNVIDGYYAVTAKCREDARYNLDVRLMLEKRSAQPVDPPLPYIVYGDRSVALNMDYYNRVGGSRPSNERAWDSLMNAATQIDRCFTIRSASAGAVTTPAAASGKRIVEIKRARLNEDGSVAAKGEIVLD